MTHTVGAVIVPARISITNQPAVEEYLASVLERYCEELEVPRYIQNEDWQGELKTLRENPWYQREQPENATMTDERLLTDFGWEKAEDGNGWVKWSTYNPDSQWDWYVVGGRWHGEFAPHDVLGCDEAVLESTQWDGWPYSIVNLAGEWLTQGDVGWWGVTEDKMTSEQWAERFIAALQEDPEAHVVFVDFHI